MTKNKVALRPWCHINEFREEGFQKLPSMIAVTKSLVLWSPSSIYMDTLHKSDSKKFRLHSMKLLEYVEKKKVRIAGRKNWILKPESREGHPWKKYTAWNEEFDSAIRKIAIDDLKEKPKERRVLLAPLERGPQKANEAINDKSIYNEVIKLINEGNLPDGLKEKISKKEFEREKVWEVLKDMWNHRYASKDCAASHTIFRWDEVISFFKRTNIESTPDKIDKNKEELATLQI